MNGSERQAKLVEAMVGVASTLYVTAVSDLLGDIGVERLRDLLGTIRELYQFLPCEMMVDGLTVYVHTDDDAASKDSLEGSTVTTADKLMPSGVSGATVRVEAAGRIRVWAEQRNLSTLPSTAIVYHFRFSAELGPTELMHVGGVASPIPNVSGFPSAFGVPTFSDLAAALSKFEDLANGPDPHLDVAWRDERRLAFAPKPERHMRRALELYLRHAIRDAHVTVRPEQNVNETEPVDIEVAWTFQGRIAWIEIKWLGHSGPVGGNAWSTSYSESRAVDGARQLADYLASGRVRVRVPVMGHLVVFDARRKGLKPEHAAITSDNGLHYRLRDVQYPSEICSRSDFAAPVRIFMSPIT